MNLRVTDDDPLWLRRMKLMYLVPFVVLAILPMAVWQGLRTYDYAQTLDDIQTAWRGS